MKPWIFHVSKKTFKNPNHSLTELRIWPGKAAFLDTVVFGAVFLKESTSINS